MNDFTRTKRQSLIIIILGILAANLIVLAVWMILKTYAGLQLEELAAVLVSLSLISSIVIGLILSSHLTQPLKALWQLIVHISSEHSTVPAPQIDNLTLGKQMVEALANQIYKLGSSNPQDESATSSSQSIAPNPILNNLPLPMFVLDKEETIVFANVKAAEYIGLKPADIISKNFYQLMDMSFPSENTLDKWLNKVKSDSVTATMSWERVRLNVQDNHPTLLFDLAAYYNKDNPNNYETMLLLFDHTKQYSQDDQAIGFVALSVHELRTPLTILRGYIEALEEEMGEQMNPQLQDFMQKMSATAQQLTAFVNNILNVARVDNDQMQLQLQEQNWGGIVVSAINNISLRAQVRGIKLEAKIAPNLPTVGVDRLSIYEVINNLIDNAIKYSGNSKTINIDAHMNNEGMVETTVQDYGLGISPSIMPNLFTKFYRDHHNRAQIGGTGLGLYLSKAIIDAHGGNIWVRSKPGEGSTFGFTLMPYSMLADEIKNSDNKEIARGAHGWIKNHSLYRR